MFKITFNLLASDPQACDRQRFLRLRAEIIKLLEGNKGNYPNLDSVEMFSSDNGVSLEIVVRTQGTIADSLRQGKSLLSEWAKHNGLELNESDDAHVVNPNVFESEGLALVPA